ncbi:MAG TPA: acyltransferase [Spirochaetota bacterium]|nr:acyltransferase [Spirochaetota bacterium]HPS86931.1 acyltransferase [Spirochaetota bacterium]
MLSFLPGKLKGVISILLFSINTVFWVTLLLTVSAFRIIIPLKFWYRFTSKVSIFIANSWITGNNLMILLLYKIDWDVEFSGDLKMDDWYLVLSNHQTWIDIIVLQKVLLYKIPFLKFFLKKELIWVPVLGPAWWSLEFPFMKRYSKEFLAKNPHLKGKDIESTRKACEKYKTMPISIMNFMEGTRFTEAKHDKQQSPYKNLLKPKAGGISLVMNSMGEMLHKIADVTIYYPEGAKTFWEFLCGKTTKIVVRVNIIPITDEIRGDYVNNPEFSKKFQVWLNDYWAEKDKFLTELKKK